MADPTLIWYAATGTSAHADHFVDVNDTSQCLCGLLPLEDRGRMSIVRPTRRGICTNCLHSARIRGLKPVGGLPRNRGPLDRRGTARSRIGG